MGVFSVSKKVEKEYLEKSTNKQNDIVDYIKKESDDVMQFILSSKCRGLFIHKVEQGFIITERTNLKNIIETNKRFMIGIDILGYKNISYMEFDKEKDLAMNGYNYDIYINHSIFIKTKTKTNKKPSCSIKDILGRMGKVLDNAF